MPDGAENRRPPVDAAPMDSTEMITRREGRLSAVVAVLIAFTTLVGASVGYLQAEASNSSSDYRLRAEQLSLEALGSAQRAQQQAQVEYEAFARAVEQRTAASSALLRSFYEGSDAAEEERLLLEQARWERLAEASTKLSDIDPAGEFGPEQDPTFPARYFASEAYDAFRLNALQDAANEEASQLDEHAASYTAILAMLAVSLYLFGLTLAEHSHLLRRGFLVVGLALLVVGASWTAATATAPRSAAADEAATAYASGQVAAATAIDSAGYRQAEGHFTRAIELRPTFARAYIERAGVTVAAATPQRSGFASIIPDEALERARQDLERAADLGLGTAPVYGSLGFYAFVEGTQSGDAALLAQSIDFSRRAIELDAGYPIFPFNLGVALVAAQRFDEARAAYADGIGDVLYVDAAHTTLRNDPQLAEDWLAGALTDLAIVERHRPDLAEQIGGLKEMIVGPISRADVATPPASVAALSDVQLEVRPEGVQWWATIADYDATRDTFSTQWYRRDPDGMVWAALPEVSGTNEPFMQAGGTSTVYRRYVDAIFPPACLPPGQYRAEIYVNGRIAVTHEVEAGFEPLEAFVARDITLGFCRPVDWSPLEGGQPGLLAGYRSDDGHFGIYGFRYALPRSVRQLDDISAQIADATLTSFGEFFPGTPVYREASGTTDEFFLGLEQPAWRWYDTGSGWLRAAAGLTEDGAVLVGVVFGPYDWFDSGEPQLLLRSIGQFE